MLPGPDYKLGKLPPIIFTIKFLLYTKRLFQFKNSVMNKISIFILIGVSLPSYNQALDVIEL